MEKLIKIDAKVVRHGRYVTLPVGRGCSTACSVRAGPGLDCRPASATAKTSMTKRIRMSEAVQQGKCAKPRVDHAWIAGFVAINGPWAKMTTKLIWINDSIGELWVLLQPEGVLLGKCRSSHPSGLLGTWESATGDVNPSRLQIVAYRRSRCCYPKSSR